jgi:hypothetical protein
VPQERQADDRLDDGSDYVRLLIGAARSVEDDRNAECPVPPCHASSGGSSVSWRPEGVGEDLAQAEAEHERMHGEPEEAQCERATVGCGPGSTQLR